LSRYHRLSICLMNALYHILLMIPLNLPEHVAKFLDLGAIVIKGEIKMTGGDPYLDDAGLQLLLKTVKSPDNYKRLQLYAQRLISEYRLPADSENKDIVHEAIESLIIPGQRTWNREKYPNPMSVLYGIIRSICWNRLQSDYTKHHGGYLDELEHSKLLSDPSTPLDDIINAELAKKQANMIDAAIGDDTELMEVYFQMCDGHEKPREIAEVLGISEKAVYNRLRRLRRHLYKIRDQEDMR
jgi:DNA-directed RNA polymerase specialized sigma24 family protein